MRSFVETCSAFVVVGLAFYGAWVIHWSVFVLVTFSMFTLAEGNRRKKCVERILHERR